VALGQVSYEYILFYLSTSWHQPFTFVLHLSSKKIILVVRKCVLFFGAFRHCYIRLSVVVFCCFFIIVVVNIYCRRFVVDAVVVLVFVFVLALFS